MKTVGIICEYNPLHRGHEKQFRLIREHFGPETAIVCLMSGDYVQRGAPACVDKTLRAKAAVASGADLVLELPVTYALSSAEGFAAGGVEILGKFCDHLCFGSETGNAEDLMATARALLSPEFSPLLREYLDTGLSFPAARAKALAQMGLDSDILTQPNDILAVEYCKAMVQSGCAMQPFPIRREGGYHDELPDCENPSATALRRMMEQQENWLDYVPDKAKNIFENASRYTLEAGEKAVLARLRTMTEAEFEALPYGSEGLWRKFMHAVHSQSSCEAIIDATKSKRYTRTRIQRMLMCAYLGITNEILSTPAPYVRALAFNDTGRQILKPAKARLCCLNAGEVPDHPYWCLEKQWSDLYGMFRTEGCDAPGREEKRRVYYHKEQS